MRAGPSRAAARPCQRRSPADGRPALLARARPARRGGLRGRVRELEWAVRMLLGACIVLSCACASRRAAKQVSGADDRLREIHIEGNEALDDELIEQHLNLAETTWFPLPKRRYLFEGFLEVDRDRIEQLYDAYGYHDAVVVDVRVDRVRDEVADVTFVVEEGEPTLVRAIELLWPEGPPSGPEDRRSAPRHIETKNGLSVGTPFEVEEMQHSEAAMEAALQDRGYAFAEVVGRARVDRVGKTADIEFTIVPGPFVRIGRVEIEGLQTVPEHPVRVEAEPHQGKPFSPSRIQGMEDAVYGLDVFSSVTVTHSQEPRDGVVDVKIAVEEGRPQQLKLGVGLGLQPNRWEQFGAIRYTHANLGRTLTHLTLQLRAGYAELPTLYRPQEHGPIAKLEPRLRKKGLLEDQLVWTLEPSFELGVWEGYQFYAPSNRVGVTRFFTRFVELGLSHTVRFVDFFDVSPVLDQSRSVLGLDYRDPYLLSHVSPRLTLHLTDRLLDPRHGVVLSTQYDIAGGIFGGQFDFHRITPELRAYYTPLRNRLQLAARGQLGFIVPFGDEPGAPFDLKYYLGGSNTVRGWGLRRLSPFVTQCNAEGASCRRIPVGGYTSVLANVEVRTRAWRGLWVVAFFDMGDVQAEVATFRPETLSYSVGPALRYDTPIGTIRLDLGIRLNDPNDYVEAGEPRWALHFGLGETF